jgi:DNA-binding NarL/FixJ family response regulator
MTHLANGLSVKQCAQRMRLTESTVDNYKWRLMKRLEIHKAAELTRLAVREGLVVE